MMEFSFIFEVGGDQVGGGRKEAKKEGRKERAEKVLFDSTNFSSYGILDNYLSYEISSYSLITLLPTSVIWFCLNLKK